jgi:hypothetical protein
MTTRKKQKPALNLGLNVDAVNILLNTAQAISFAKELVADDGAPLPGTSGSGVLKYDGEYYFEKSVFIGKCDTTKKAKIQFFGQEGFNQATRFLSAYSGADESISDDFDLSSADFTYYCPPFTNTPQQRAFTTALEETVSLQQSNKVTVACHKGELTIGSKSSNSKFVSVSCEANAGNVSGVIARAKVAGSGAKSLWASLKANAGGDIGSCLASFLIMDLLGKVTQSPILVDIRNDVSKNYAIGKVVTPPPTQTGGVKSSSRSGVYVLKSLSGIKNKLKDVSSNKETQGILAQWLSILVSETTIPNHGELMRALQDALSGQPAAGVKKGATPVRRTRTAGKAGDEAGGPATEGS